MKIIKNIIPLLLVFIFALPVWAVAETELDCGEIDRQVHDTRKETAPWFCPHIETDLTSAELKNITVKGELANVNLRTGEYQCLYRRIDNSEVAEVCNYVATDYKNKLSKKMQDVSQYFDITTGDTTFKSFADDYPSGLIEDRTDIEKGLETKLENLSSEVIKVFGYLDEFSNKAKTSNGYLYIGTDIGADVIANNSYNMLVKPYVEANSEPRLEQTFSRFITGIITLDPEVVKSYEHETGNLNVSDGWKGPPPASDPKNDLFKYVREFFENKAKTENIIDTNEQELVSWVKLFTGKIWGFYYNLERRLDIGYDIIVTQLLFLMMVFFAMGATARGGARYIANRENGQSSGEIKVNEASIMKTLGVLATVFAFYISIPSTYVSKTNGVDYITHEMRTNNSLAKEFIRYAIKEGTYFGTMMSDLGTDAFINFVIRKQGLYTGSGERINLIGALQEMVYFYPATYLTTECKEYYGVPEHTFLSANQKGSIGINPEVVERGKGILNDSLLTDENTYGLSYALCHEMYAQKRNALKNLAETLSLVKNKLDKQENIRSKATMALVNNHIALQKDIGWMNIITVPYTYFMMKNHELFFDSAYSLEDIYEDTKDYREGLGSYDSDNVLANTSWYSQTEEIRKRVDSANSIQDSTERTYSRLAFYNFLPSFTSIRNEVHQRMQALYSDILRVQRERNARSKNSKNNHELIDSFQRFLKSTLEQAHEHYPKLTEVYKLEEIFRNIKNTGDDPIELHKVFQVLSYLIAISIWKTGFVIVFLSSIAMIIGLKIVMYVINVLIHFFVAPFMVVWAFASTDTGMGKIKGYMRDTLVYMLYPSIMVLGVFVFIFAYELFYSIYGFITSVLIQGQLDAVGQGLVGSGPITDKVKDEMAYLSVYSLKDITEILIDLLSVYVAFVTINKFPEIVLKTMGLGDSSAITLSQSTEKVLSQGGGHVSPLSH